MLLYTYADDDDDCVDVVFAVASFRDTVVATTTSAAGVREAWAKHGQKQESATAGAAGAATEQQR